MSTRDEIVERFTVRSENGTLYDMHKIQTSVRITTTSGSGWGRGAVRFELSNGTHANPRSETEFEIVWLDRADNEIAHRVD